VSADGVPDAIDQVILPAMTVHETLNTTVVFADVAGSSKLYKDAGNDEAIRRISALMNQLAQTVHKHHGVVIKTIGDEIMCHFPVADDACDACVAFQAIGEQSLPLRIGLSSGNVIARDNDLFGQAVNDAAAVARVARARQSIATETFRAKLSADRAKCLSVFDHIKLKGHAEVSTIYRIEWEGSSANASTTSRHTIILSSIAVVQQQLNLGFCKVNGEYDTLMLTAENVPLHIGRDSELCQLPSPSTLASRDHCHIDYAHGKFVLVDHSTNGTYMRNNSGQQVYLRRQETPLLGEGAIGLGEQVTDGNPFVIRFNC
jgi:class 3 adenylate cyclase